MKPPHPTEAPNRPEDRRWERLLLDGERVGYRRQIGGTTLFSKDGYGWSARHIHHDVRLPEARFKGPSLRVFHGDVVVMGFRHEAPEQRRLVVLVPSAGEDALFDPESGEVGALETLWPSPHTPFAKTCVGSIWGDEELQERSLTVLQALRAETQPRLTMVALAAAALLLGVTLSGCLQWVIVGGVGPLTSVLGGFLAALLLLAYWKRSVPHVFSRRWALGMTWRVALLCGIASALVPTVAGEALARVVGIGITGVMLSGLTWLLSADLVAWRTGGFERERSARRGARPRRR